MTKFFPLSNILGFWEDEYDDNDDDDDDEDDDEDEYDDDDDDEDDNGEGDNGYEEEVDYTKEFEGICFTYLPVLNNVY